MITPDNRAVMRRRYRLCLTLALFLPLGTLWAETGYVIDKLLVGVHQDKNLDSAIIKVLATGTRLEVLERDGELALVEDPDKVRGWVDAAYLTADLPAQLRLAELERDKAGLEKQLAALRSTTADNPAVAPAADAAAVNELTKENTELKAKLSDERLRAGKLQSEAAALRTELNSNNAPPDARIIELERDRNALRNTLDDAEEQIAELSARASLKAIAELVPLVLREYASAIGILVFVIAALGFGGGIWVFDMLNRRRHGGFRV